jgi:surfeit locus 1 family protein
MFLTVAVLICFLKLGFWQLDRAKEKTFLKERFEAGLQTAPLSLDALPGHLPNSLYLPVTATGYYDNAHSILLDNKIHNHQVGYEVITPLQIAGKKRRILVNRGWVPAPQQRRILPDIPHISGKQNVTGLVYLPPEKPFTLEKKGATTTVAWPYRVQVLDIPHIEQTLHMPLYPFVVQLDAQEDHGFVRDWQPVNLSPDKHLGYAAQWFTFAGVLIIIFVALNLKRRI